MNAIIEPKAIVQLGLHKTCEYVYLVDEEFKSINAPVKLSGFKYDNLHYYGIDMRLDSIKLLKLSKMVGNHPRIHFLRKLIHSDDGTKITHDGGCVDPHGRFTTLSTSLQTLLSSIGMPIHLLVVDIEGCEVPMFETYNFSIKPEYIFLETHGYYGAYPQQYLTVEGQIKEARKNEQKISDIIRGNGYCRVFDKLATREIYTVYRLDG